METVNAKPFIDGYVHIPFSLFSKQTADALKRRLTFTVKSYVDWQPDKKVETFIIEDDAETIAVPYFFGLQQLQIMGIPVRQEQINDGVCIGNAKRLPDPSHPSAPPKQAQFFDALLLAMRTKRTVLAVAATGSGKTWI